MPTPCDPFLTRSQGKKVSMVPGDLLHHPKAKDFGIKIVIAFGVTSYRSDMMNAENLIFHIKIN
jgi:hypothetical protein